MVLNGCMWYLGFIGYDQPIVESTVILAGSRLNALCLSIPSEHVNIFSENLTSLESEIRMSTNSHFSFICCCCFFFAEQTRLEGLELGSKVWYQYSNSGMLRSYQGFVGLYRNIQAYFPLTR